MESSGKLIRSLKLRHVVFFGLAYMAPYAVFDTFGIVSEITNGHVPAAYILITIAILFTAYSYGKMVKVYPSAGSAYFYTRRTINSGLGFLVGWAALLDYLFLPMINALLSYIYFSSAFPNVPNWVWIVGTIVVTTALNMTGVKLANSINLLMVIFEFLVAVIFVILTIRGITNGGEFTIVPFSSESATFSGLFAGASILALSFLGFDAITTMSEETIKPTKNIPRGIFLIALLGGIFFITVTYFMQLLFPDVSLLNNTASASPEIAKYIGGVLFQSIFIAGAGVAVIACGLTQQMSASRLLYAMGRDGVLPKNIFGYIHPRSGIPIYNVLFVSLIAFTALFLDLETATSLINFGAFTAFAFVNLTVIFYYFRQKRPHTTTSIIGNVIAPFIGFAFNTYLWYNLESSALIVGIIWVALGIIYLLYLTKFFSVTPPELDFDETKGI